MTCRHRPLALPPTFGGERQASIRTLPLLMLSAALALAGCSSMTERQRDTTVGAAGGAVVGGVLGGRTGAVVGGVAGGVAGNLWSRHMEDKREALARATAGTGVEVARTADNHLKMNIPADVSFDVGQSAIKPAMRPVLDELGSHLDPDVRVTIVGHTDSTGPASVNDPLSLDRAEAVREYLVNHGVQRGRLLVEGRGARQPLASNATEAGRAANRRVEIFLSQPAS
jgi:outer membrane protein OmpA-like peptidoglycan-associated protein